MLRVAFPLLALIGLLIFLLLPYLAALEINVLSDQTWPNGLALQSRVLARVMCRDEQTVLGHAVHDKVLKLDLANLLLPV